MITADEARRKTIINTRAKELMTLCEQNVLNAATNGDYSTRVMHHYFAEKDRVIVDSVIAELCFLGYKAETTWFTENSSDPEYDIINIININWEQQK